MKGVLCLGEALIDFIPLDADNLTYQKAPGGAPANVSVGVAKLGGKATFLGKVGDDVLGHFLKETLEGYGVNTRSMIFSEKARTGVTFVSLEASGERHFSFYINPSADQFLQKEELDASLFTQHKIFHFGSISQINEPSKSTTFEAIKKAKESGMLISYDPNFRRNLWRSEKQAKETILATIPYVDILKVSDEELSFLTGCSGMEEGITLLPKVQLILVTLGSEGCLYYFKGKIGTVPALTCQAVDTTGAGDAFVSGILYSLNESARSLEDHSEPEIVEMIRFANISGGLSTTKKGAMTGLPTLQEIQALLKNQK
ncbi:aminoimidazole riboside kinase [Rummeliibacillus sp. NPDC094406]|uniref:aminoimidazole riboside kinase n=1 Tax=Rummeliibacillus sp. NPDC094406 TaxID=3364511 RepID=UPI00381AD479